MTTIDEAQQKPKRGRGRPRKGEEPSEEGGYINHTRERILPASSRFLSADQIAKELGISRAYAYNKIREINKELEKQGVMIFPGRVLRKVWIERTGG